MITAGRCSFASASDLVEVDLMGFGIDAILYRVEPLAGEIGPGAVGEMAAGIEAHAEDRVACLG